MEKEKSFFGKILEDLFEVFKAGWQKFFKKTYNNSVPAPIKEKVDAIVVMVELAKTMIDSPMADILTAIIPGDWDDKAKDFLRRMLPVYLAKWRDLTVADNAHNLSTNLIMDVTGMPYGQASVTGEMAYQNRKLEMAA